MPTLSRRAALLRGAALCAWSPVLAAEQKGRLDTLVARRVSLPYLIWMPSGERPAAGWPLMLFLHGSGERGSVLDKLKTNGPPKLAAAGRQFPFVLVAPQLPDQEYWQSEALDALVSDLQSRLPVDPDRLIVTGLSIGGMGAWRYAMDYPNRPAAVAPICGAADPRDAARIAKLPIWAFHGAQDDAVPIGSEQRVVDAVNAAGGHVRFTVFPELGHNVWDTAYADETLYDWMLAQHRSRA